MVSHDDQGNSFKSVYIIATNLEPIITKQRTAMENDEIRYFKNERKRLFPDWKLASEKHGGRDKNCRFTEDSPDFDLPDEFVDDDFGAVCL